MDKTPVPHIDARMGGHLALGKQDQIPGANQVTGYRLSPMLQPGDGARRCHPGPGLVHMANEATAIKTGVRRVAPIAVRRSHQTNGINGDVFRLRLREPCWHLQGLTSSAPLGRWRGAAACQHERKCHDRSNEAGALGNTAARFSSS